MDKKEPTLSKPDMADLEFRPTSYRGPTRPTADNDGLVWKLSVGVGAAVLTALLIFNAYERYQDRKDAEAAMRMLNAELARQRAEEERFLREHAPVRTLQIPAAAPAYTRPLSEGERCLRGERFKRIENGWQQLPHDPC